MPPTAVEISATIGCKTQNHDSYLTISFRFFQGTKLHAQYCAPRSWAKARAHEVFAHPFRLPRRGEKMAHLFLLCVCIAKKRQERSSASFQPADIIRNRISVMPADIFLSDKAVKGRNQLTRRHKKAILKNTEESKFATA